MHRSGAGKRIGHHETPGEFMAVASSRKAGKMQRLDKGCSHHPLPRKCWKDKNFGFCVPFAIS